MKSRPHGAVTANEATRFVGGVLPPPAPEKRRGTRVPPSAGEIAFRLSPLCVHFGITRLDLFGSVARGDCTLGSDVDLIATFRKTPGIAIVTIAEAMEEALGVPVNLLLAEDVDENENPFRRELIQRDRRTIYAA